MILAVFVLCISIFNMQCNIQCHSRLNLHYSLWQIKLVPCFHDIVVPTLSQGWETGAVIDMEVLPNNRWAVGPCTSDGILRWR